MEEHVCHSSPLLMFSHRQQQHISYNACNEDNNDGIYHHKPNNKLRIDDEDHLMEGSMIIRAPHNFDNQKMKHKVISYRSFILYGVTLVSFVIVLLFDAYQNNSHNINVKSISSNDNNNHSNRMTDSNLMSSSKMTNTKSNIFLSFRRNTGLFRQRQTSLSAVSDALDDYSDDDSISNNNESLESESIRIAFLGNSIMYYNDCPRLVQQMMMDGNIISNHNIEQDSCLRGGASISSLWKDGNGVTRKFKTKQALISMEALSQESISAATPTAVKSNKRSSTYRLFHHMYGYDYELFNNYYDVGERNPKELLMKYNNIDQSVSNNGWDFVVVNDYTQGPARERSRQRSIRTIKEKIAPLLLSSTNTIPIIVQTHAYRIPNIKGSIDLGDFNTFSDKLKYGVQEYAKAFNEVLLDSNTDDNHSQKQQLARIAPVGEAYRYIYEYNNILFHKLYSWDNIHPSPYGTYLQANIIYMTCYPNHIPPLYNNKWWDASRYIMPPPPNGYDHNTDDYEINHYNIESYELHFPNDIEANELRRVAGYIMGYNYDITTLD